MPSVQDQGLQARLQVTMRVRMTEGENPTVVGLMTKGGELVRIGSPRLRTAMGRRGVLDSELKPMRRGSFDLMCGREGLELPEVISHRWDTIETERLATIESVLELREKLIDREEAKLKQNLSSNKEEMKKLNKIWVSVDQNGDGHLDKDEVKQVFAQMGKQLPEKDFEVVMAAMDTDGNGTVEYDEFSVWWKATMLADEHARRLKIEKQRDQRQLEAMNVKAAGHMQQLQEAEVSGISVGCMQRFHQPWYVRVGACVRAHAHIRGGRPSCTRVSCASRRRQRRRRSGTAKRLPRRSSGWNRPGKSGSRKG
jgi:hypothetical protein